MNPTALYFRLVFAAALTLGATATVSAQGDVPLFAKGVQEVQTEGMIDFDSGRGTRIDLTLGYGIFVQDYLEVGGRVSIARDDEAVAFGLAGFAEYNFDNGTWMIPFVGGSLGYETFDDAFYGDDAGLILGAYGGAKYFLRESVAITGTLNVEFGSGDVFLSDDGLDSTNIEFRLGLRAYFY